jgi:hypothetical protein
MNIQNISIQTQTLSTTTTKQTPSRFSRFSLDIQSKIESAAKVSDNAGFRNFLKEIGYEGEPIASLNQEEAKALVSKDGFFSLENTAQRIADFVILGAKDDQALLNAGIEGIKAGLKQAESLWGGTLPDLAYETTDLALKQVNDRLDALL